MDIDAADKSVADEDYDGPLAPCGNGNIASSGVRMSRECIDTATTSSRPPVEDVRRDTQDHTNNDTRPRTSTVASDKLDETLDDKLVPGAKKFICESCKSHIQEDVLVFVLKDEKAVCSRCALKEGKKKNLRCHSQMMVSAEIDKVLEIRDAKQVAKSVVRVGEYVKKQSYNGVRIANEDFETKCNVDDRDNQEAEVMAPVYARDRGKNHSGKLPRRFGDDSRSLRRHVRRASEPQINRPTFDSNLMVMSVVALSDTM